MTYIENRFKIHANYVNTHDIPCGSLEMITYTKIIDYCQVPRWDSNYLKLDKELEELEIIVVFSSAVVSGKPVRRHIEPLWENFRKIIKTNA